MVVTVQDSCYAISTAIARPTDGWTDGWTRQMPSFSHASIKEIAIWCNLQGKHRSVVWATRETKAMHCLALGMLCVCVCVSCFAGSTKCSSPHFLPSSLQPALLQCSTSGTHWGGFGSRVLCNHSESQISIWWFNFSLQKFFVGTQLKDIAITYRNVNLFYIKPVNQACLKVILAT